MYQFEEVVAWELRAELHNGNKLWRMGFVMNDLATCVRVMILNGRMFVLRQDRLVRFNYAGELVHVEGGDYKWDIPDMEFLPESELLGFTDDDWDYEEDLEEEIRLNRRLSTAFVKDKA